MGLQYRAIRAAASALLVAAAVGTGGMAGMTNALATDPVDVALTGTVVASDNAPLADIHLQITEIDPVDGAIAAAQVTTAADGSFSAILHPWGTAGAPAKVTISAHEELERVGETCSQTWAVDVSDAQDVALADGPPEPLRVTATTTLLGEVCGTTATPPPDSQTGGRGPALTPPPTDTFAAPLRASAADRHGTALSMGFVVGLLLATALLLPRRGARRRG